MEYPSVRARRLRRNKNLRRLIKDTYLSVDDLVMPFFICEGRKVRRQVPSMPGVYQVSVDNLLKEVGEAQNLKIPAILLFGIPSRKDSKGTQAYIKEGIIQKAVRALKRRFSEILVITDVCLCEYTSHGHCGVIRRQKREDFVDNDATLKVLAKVALSHAEAGADIIAPSSMMDGQVRAIRDCLDKNGFSDISIMSYSAKYASGFYGPFRDAAQSSPQFGDRRSYQQDWRVSWEALKEVELDLKEGADIVMVKPALCYLDIIRRVKDRFNVPLAAYNVSGEYSMVKAASLQGWIKEKECVYEILTGIKRAGADIIITYYAKDVARWLSGDA
jgi:porphobilinogen synthase